MTRHEFRHLIYRERTAAYEALIIARRLFPWRTLDKAQYVVGYVPPRVTV